MRISNILMPLCALLGPCLADELTLSGGLSRLSGAVRSINEAGVVEVASELSPAPLLLKEGAVVKVGFSGGAAAPETATALIELANGDMLPATIEGLDDRRLAVISPQAGRLEIPRESLKSIQPGIRPRRVIYQGPRGLAEWTGAGGEMKNWVFERDSLVSSGPAAAAMMLPLPPRFTLRFTMEWQAGQSPNFQVFFADPLLARGEPCDRYYLQFGGAGLEIKREAAKGKRYNTILLLNRTPDQFPENRLQVELRVNRTESKIQLFLNGEPEGAFADPIAPAPAGSGIAIIGNPPNGVSQEIRGIEVIELDDSQRRHRAEDRGDATSDSLISREDDRWGGRLLEIRKTAGTAVFRFKSGFQEEPLEIPEKDVSTVFFASEKPEPAREDVPGFILRLHGAGFLRVSSCRFGGDSVSAVHPLLGALSFRREGIAAIERSQPETRTAPEP